MPGGAGKERNPCSILALGSAPALPAEARGLRKTPDAVLDPWLALMSRVSEGPSPSPAVSSLSPSDTAPGSLLPGRGLELPGNSLAPGAAPRGRSRPARDAPGPAPRRLPPSSARGRSGRSVSTGWPRARTALH